MNPAEFATKWAGSARTERAASQEHFIDLCRMLGAPTPNEADATGEFYAFEKGAEKTGGGDGFADVWRRGHFAWEYKGKRRDLKAAYQQLLLYREALENPPLLVVCDLNRFEVHTNFTNTPAIVHAFTLADLLDHPEEPLRVLRAVMAEPEALKPGKTREELTYEAAEQFASLAETLRGQGHEAHQVAHFLNKLLFCMFAEDAGLLPGGLLLRLTEAGKDDPATFASALGDLFGKMSVQGGLFGAERIQWFNGGLFDGPETLPLGAVEIRLVQQVSRLDWSQVEPAIFGTLFERGLDPSKRSQLGAHYTDRRAIMRIIDPVLMTPLRRELEDVKTRISAIVADGTKITARTPAARNPHTILNDFLERLRTIRVLDPACGSGNFLYLALQALKDLEREAILWASLEMGVPLQFPRIGPDVVLGLELNSYAAELARVVIWIGEIQWMLSNGFAYVRDPILRPLNNIECRDAVLDLTDESEPREPSWPHADVIIGNPPFLGGKLMRTNLGSDYVDALFAVWKGRVSAEADLVCYWHEKARAMVEVGDTERVGLLATQGIRGGANRRTLERIKDTGDLFMAWSDEPWVVEGAAVRVSLIGFDNGSEPGRVLDGHEVLAINADLTTGLDLTMAISIDENAGIAFMGDTKGGSFDIPGELARGWLPLPNPDGRSNAKVVRPWVNGLDITRRPRDMWIVDFGVDMPIEEAALYEVPFGYVAAHVRPVRVNNRRPAYAQRWWLHVEPRSGMRAALAGLGRFIGTPRLTKHRLFVWLSPETMPDSQVIVFAREDDYFFGVLHSKPHELWALGKGTQLEDRPRYTPTTTFETFPFPRPSPEQKEAIAEAARSLDGLRNGWLNPPGAADDVLTQRTLTALYNEQPAWLQHAHERIDRAVHAAYAWPYPLDGPDVLTRLLELNLARAATQSNHSAA